MKTPISLVVLAPALLAVALLSAAACSAPPEEADPLHARYSELLATYVQSNLVDYDAWAQNPEDLAALAGYVEGLAALDPVDWPRDNALAYWLNLYNAVTLRLVLDNYPLESIKDLGGFMKSSPWKRELVTVAGRELTLNQIENDIIRPTFGDARIHFALNCASLGCPPLVPEAYVADRLSAQLDGACRLALNQDRWVLVVDQKLKLTKIFDWYGQDFTADGGTVLDFIRHYRTKALPSGTPKIDYLSYDWALNRVP